MLTTVATAPKVVVIEDDEDERVALGRILRINGFAVSSYASAEAFLQEAPAGLSCLLLDMHLEGMSGLELMRVLRGKGSVLPIIIITASDEPDSRVAAEQLGCLAYLRKPFQARALVEMIRSRLTDVAFRKNTLH